MLIPHSLVSLGTVIHHVLTAQVIFASPLMSPHVHGAAGLPCSTARHHGAGLALPRTIGTAAWGALRKHREEAPAWCCGVVREGRGVDEEQRGANSFLPQEKEGSTPPSNAAISTPFSSRSAMWGGWAGLEEGQLPAAMVRALSPPWTIW